jgi:thiol:disulfide interchange protein DsbD
MAGVRKPFLVAGVRNYFVVLILALAAFLPALGSLAAAPDKVTWRYALDPAVAHPGEAVAVRLTAAIADPWYMYAPTLKAEGPVALQVRLDLPPGFRASGPLEAPKPETKFDEGFTTNVEIYHGATTFTQRIVVPENAQPTTVPIKGAIRFQTCSGASCLPPRTVPFALTLAIEAGPVRPEYKAPAAAAPTTQTNPALAPFQERPSVAASASVPLPSAAAPAQGAVADFKTARNAGLLAFLVLALVQGLLALATPCVYPMIPITVSYFIKQGEQQGRSPVLMAALYVLSIVATFTAVGLLLAGVVGPTGAARLGANPIANLFLAALFVAFALNLFGAFEIRVPAGVQTRLSQRGRAGNYGATIFLGLAFTLASLTCTAPFIGTLLGVAATGEWFWPLVGMLGFAAAFALPFFFLALFPQYLAVMPKSGGWLNSVKVVMGFLVLAAALKFAGNVDVVWNWNLFTRPVVLSAWVAIAVLCGVYLLGAIRLPHDSPVEHVGPVRLLISVVFLALGLYLAAGLFGRPINGTLDAFLPAEEMTAGEAPMAQYGPRLDWIEDYDLALARARAEGKPIFIDFTGKTCTNCKWMDRNILSRDDVSRLLARFVRARLWTDVGPRWRQNQQMQVDRFGTAALPLYAIQSPDDRTLARFEGLTRKPELFVEFLQSGLARLRP